MPSKQYKVTVGLVSTVIDPDDLLSTSVMLFRDYLRANLTDPLEGSRNEEYVYTNYPSRDVEYPHVIVTHVGGTGDRMGGNSWTFDFFLAFSFDTLHKNVADLDTITGNLLKVLKNSMATFHDWGLQRPRWLALGRWNPMPGVRGVYRRTTELSFHTHIS